MAPLLLFGDTRSRGKGNQAIVDLYDGLRPFLLAYLTGVGLGKEEAEDIIQECFLRLIGGDGKYVDQKHLRSWMFRVAHNLAIDQFRSATYRNTTGGVEVNTVEHQLFDKALSPEEAVIQAERWRRMQQAIGRLTPQQRSAVLLRSEGLRFREIAEVLGVSIKRVAELVQRALVLLAGEQ